jgi:hypothetical protein
MFHLEGGTANRPRAVRLQLRPDPLAHRPANWRERDMMSIVDHLTSVPYCGVLDEHNDPAGASERISAVAIQVELPSLAVGETTDKAYINQRAVLKNNAAVVELLYGGATSSRIIRLH